MKTESKKEEKCQVRLTVTLEAAEAGACVKEVEKTFVREVRMPGFRPGKVPIENIRKNFAKELQAETTRTMLRKYYSEAVKQEKIDEVMLAEVKESQCTAEGGSFTVMVDVKPTFKLPTYKGLKVTFNDTKVDDADVAAQIERLRVGFASYVDSKEGEQVTDGDYVQIDYSGTVGGKSILELAPDAQVVASGSGFWARVEEGAFLPEILEAVKGMKVGESKDKIAAKFDKNAAPEPLKGKKALYSLTLKAFRRRVLPSDADFVAKMNVESMDKLTADIRERMEKQAIEQESARRENEALDLLMKKVNFDVPQSQVSQTMDNYLKELAQRAQYAGLSAEYFEQNRDKILADAQANAEKQVRVWYVIDAIAAAEKIEAKDDEKGKKVMEFILANAKK